jgi:hypothetical protein
MTHDTHRSSPFYPFIAISIWIYISRTSNHKAQRASDTSTTSAVHSYLRSFLTALTAILSHSLYSLCSRDLLILIMFRMFLWFIKKIESFFRLYPIYHLTAIQIAGCWSVTDRWYKDPLRRGADAKCINRNGAGERKGSWMISLATFWGRSSS